MDTHDTIEIIAHRGASAEAPENTIPAFELAWRQGADAIECDIRLSRDGRIMVHHDAGTMRTTGRDLLVAQTHSRTLRGLDAARNASSAHAGARIPYLREVLDTASPGKRIFIEIKCGAEVLPVLRRQLPGDASARCVLIGFDILTMAAAKEAFPGLMVYWLFQRPLLSRVRGRNGDSGQGVIARTRRRSLDGLDVRSRDLTETFVAHVRAAGLGLSAWTVNDAAEAVRLAAWGVQSITTDRPGWLREQLGQGRE